MRIEENKEAIEKILQKYPYIEKYFGRFVTLFLEKDHPLINLIIRKRSYLDLLNGWLEKLDSIPNVSRI